MQLHFLQFALKTIFLKAISKAEDPTGCSTEQSPACTEWDLILVPWGQRGSVFLG